MERQSVIQFVPPHRPSGSGSDSAGDSGRGQSDGSEKPKRSRKTSKAIREEKEAEKETKMYLYMAAVEDIKSGKFENANAAHKYYDVLIYQQIHRFFKNGTSFVGSGRKLKILTKDEEKKIADHCVWRLERGFGYKHYDVALLIQASTYCQAHVQVQVR